MLYLIGVIAVCLACIVPPVPPAAQAPPAATAFPSSWVGHWTGETELIQRDGVAMRLKMELIVAPTSQADRFEWTMVYDGADGRQERKYLLFAKDAAHGEFAIDEQNSVVLPAQLVGGVLYTHFLVGDNRIATRNEVVARGTSEERMLIEMVTTHDSDAVPTGGKDGNPDVRGWLARTVQRSVLRKVK